MISPRSLRGIRHVGLLLAAALLAVYILFPLAWTVIASFQTSNELFVYPPRLQPHDPWWQNYYEVFTGRRYGAGENLGVQQTYIPRFVLMIPRATLNTVVAGIATVAACLLIGGPAAYSMSRFEFRGKGTSLAGLLALRAVPLVAFIIPLFAVMRTLGLTDSLAGLVAVYTALELPFVIWILKEYFASIPVELDDAAMIDGCSRLQVFWKIILPVMRPGLVVAGVIVFMAFWGAFLIPLILTKTEQSATLQVVVAMLIGERDTFTDYGLINAVAVVSFFPPLMLALVFQRMIMTGMFRGAIR